jgi:uncharacterized membrane protein YbhN (UPF0104 family)
VSKYRKYLEFAALLLLAGLIIWWFGRRLDWDQVKLAMRKSDWRLILAAAAVILIAYLWRAIRWQALLKPLTQTSLREVWVATTVGFGAILLIGRAGEVVRPVVLPMRDHRVRPAASFVTIMIERLYDSVTVVLLFALSLLWLKPAGGGERFARARMPEPSGGLLIVAVSLLIWFRKRSQTVIGWLDRRINSRSPCERESTRDPSTLEQLQRR